MKDLKYWTECISQAFDDAGISASAEQIAQVAYFVEGAALELPCYLGAPARDDDPVGKKIAELEKALAIEQLKTGCPACRGAGRINEICCGRKITTECDCCHGEGKI